jgi:hypothetical protein
MFTNWGLGDSTVKESETKINEILGSASLVDRLVVMMKNGHFFGFY